MFDSGVDEVELALVGTLDSDLGRRRQARHAFQQPRQRPSREHDVNESARRIEAIVVAVVLIAEKHVAAHLTGDARSRFTHLLLNQRVPRLPHDRLPTSLTNGVLQHLRALHIENDLLLRLSGQRVESVDQQ